MEKQRVKPGCRNGDYPGFLLGRWGAGAAGGGAALTPVSVAHVLPQAGVGVRHCVPYLEARSCIRLAITVLCLLPRVERRDCELEMQERSSTVLGWAGSSLKRCR